MWNTAGIAGLALGAVSSAYLLSGQFIAGDLTPATLWQQVLSLVLWGIKFSICIWIIKFSMTRFAIENGNADKKQIFKMGVAASLLSSLVFSGFYLANMMYLSADFYNQIFETILQEADVSLDSNSKATLERIIPMLPQIIFFSNFIYCFVFGTVLSAILSRNISNKDQFAEFNQEER